MSFLQNTIYVTLTPPALKSTSCTRVSVNLANQSSAFCTSDSDCTLDKSCNRNRGECFNPCSLRAACGVNALCRVVNHAPRCECPECYKGRPHLGCKLDSRCSTKPEPEGRGCANNQDCPSALYCEAGECKSPCGHTSVCEANERCVAANHQATCQCKKRNRFVLFSLNSNYIQFWNILEII